MGRKLKASGGSVLTLDEIEKLPAGAVVVNSMGVVTQKHAPDTWYAAQDWEGRLSDKEMASDRSKLVTITRFTKRI